MRRRRSPPCSPNCRRWSGEPARSRSARSWRSSKRASSGRPPGFTPHARPKRTALSARDAADAARSAHETARIEREAAIYRGLSGSLPGYRIQTAGAMLAVLQVHSTALGATLSTASIAASHQQPGGGDRPARPRHHAARAGRRRRAARRDRRPVQRPRGTAGGGRHGRRLHPQAIAMTADTLFRARKEFPRLTPAAARAARTDLRLALAIPGPPPSTCASARRPAPSSTRRRSGSASTARSAASALPARS